MLFWLFICCLPTLLCTAVILVNLVHFCASTFLRVLLTVKLIFIEPSELKVMVLNNYRLRILSTKISTILFLRQVNLFTINIFEPPSQGTEKQLII